MANARSLTRWCASDIALALLLLVNLCITTTADETCRSGCQGTKNEVFKYVENQSYKYNLESNVDITLSSSEGSVTGTKLKATVLLTQQKNCNQVLRLQNVQITSADGKKHGTIPDLDKPIKTNFHDGHLEDIICAEKDDTQTSLNIKRAVASLFQAALAHTHETDVFGVCPTSFHSSKSGNVLTITKTRLLNRCSHRENAKHDFLATAFNIHSEIKSSPILKSDYTSELRVKDGILDHVLVTEHYLYMPFSAGKNGAKATVQTKLQFAGKAKDTGKVKCSEPKSIIFENPHPVVAAKCDVATILTAVKETANSIGDVVDEHTASKFSNLIQILSHAKKDDLLAAYNQIKSGAGLNNKETGKRVFLDALFRTGTGEGVEVAVALLKSNELTPLETKLVYLGMAFVRHATPSSLTTASGLLDQTNLPREAYLGIGSLVARYCSQHSCKGVEEVKKVADKFLTKLVPNPGNREQENQVVAILKGISNMKLLTDATVAKVVGIAQDKKASDRVRVAALEAFRADSCKDKIRDAAISLLKDIQQDSEIRIKAYLALADCPNGKTAAAVKSVLDNEPSYQVGGFIVSHIRNLRASANSDKELAKHELANVNTMKRFPIDPRKYSFNSEVSYAFDTLGSSSSAETNVIYSQSSYVPRSVCLNLTAEVFGHRFNFLEIDARQENVDRLLEHYLGPLGVVRSKTPDELLKNGKEGVTKIVEHIKERAEKTRSKRQIPKSEIDAMGNKVQIKSHQLNNDLDLDLSFKVFGSEMIFLSINQEATKITPDSIIDQIFDRLDEAINKIKNFDRTYTHNGMFLDTELTYPTSSGFALRLSAIGTSSVQLKTSGSVDLRAILKTKDSILKINSIPSANIEIAGRLTIDAGIVQTGLKTTSNLHTATGAAVEIEFFNNGQGIDVKVNSPLAKQQVLTAKHEIVLASREPGMKEVDTPMKFIENKDFEICLDQLSPIIGMFACFKVNSPNYQLNQGTPLGFPLTGNSVFGVWIEREEPMTFHFRDVIFTSDKKLGFSTTLEMIASNKEPKVGIQIEGYLSPEKYIKATLTSPVKNAVLEARVTDNDQEKSLSAKLNHDNQVYSGKIGFGVSGGGAKSTYKPIIEYTIPDKGKQNSPYTVQGTIGVEDNGENKKYTFNDVKLVSPNNEAITVSGNLGKEVDAVYADITVAQGSLSGSLKGRLQGNKNGVKLNAEVKNSMSPISNFALNYELKRAEHSLNSDLTFTHGENLQSKENTFKLHNSIEKFFKNQQDFKYSTKNEFSYPLTGVEGKFEFETVPKHFKYDLEGKYNNVKIGSEVDLKYNEKTKGDYDLKFEVQGLENKLKGAAKRTVTGDKSKVDNWWEINGKKMELNGEITHKIKPNDIEFAAQLVYKCPHLSGPLSLDYKLIRVPEKIDTHLKLSQPDNTYIDYELKAGKEEGANGHIKINIKDTITVAGDVKAEKWIGKANVVVNFVKVNRKMKAESTFKIAPPTYNVDFVFYPNFEKDDKKILITSTNEVTLEKGDSKNVLDVFGHKFELNLWGSQEGKPAYDGKINTDVELILPDQRYFAGKMNRELHITDGVGKGNFIVSIEQRPNKNTPGRRATLKGVLNNIKPEERTFDVVYNFAFDNTNGKSLNADLSVKREPQGDKKNLAVTAKLYGSALPDPLELELTAHNDRQSGDYDVKAKAGSIASAHVNGKFSLAHDNKPFTGDFSIDAKTSGKIKTLKFSTSGSALNADGLELSGKSKVFIEHDIKDVDSPIDFSNEADIKLLKHSGQIKFSGDCAKYGPMSFAAGYGHKEENGISKCQADVNVQYAKGKNIKGDVTVISKDKKEVSVEMKMDFPEGKTYKSHAEIHSDESSPSFKFEFVHPDGKTDKLAAKLGNLGGKHFSSELSAVYTPKDFHFDGSVEGNIESIEDFHVIAKADSPSLKLDQIVIEAENKKQKAIQLKATSKGANLFEGSTSYKTREESGKYIVEGSGEIKVKDQKQSLTFKLIKQSLSLEKNGEQGFEVTFDANLGNKGLDAEFKTTNKHFKLLNSYCEEKNQCAHFEIDAKSNKMDLTEYNNVLEVTVDLRKLGIPNEFGVKAVTNRKGLIFDHTFDLHFQSQENNKYQYNFYVHPKEAGVALTTPKRQIALEGDLQIPPKWNGPAKADLSFYLNKKTDPTKKSCLSAVLERTGDEKKGTINGELKLSAPGMAKDMKVTYKSSYDVASKTIKAEGVVDVFAKDDQKIIFKHDQSLTKDDTSGLYSMILHDSLKSTGLEMDITSEEIRFMYNKKDHSFKHMLKVNYKLGNRKFENIALFEVDPTKLHALVKLYDKEILNVESKLQLSQNSQVADTTAKIYGAKPTVSHFELKNFNTLKYTLAFKDNPNTKLVVNAGLIPGQIADFRAEVGGAELVHASVKLDEANFLKPDYGISVDNIKGKLLEPYKQQIADFTKDGKTLANDVIEEIKANSKHMQEVAKNALPKFKPVADYYASESQKIRDEINADKTLQQIGNNAKDIFGHVVTYIDGIIQRLHKLFDDLSHTIESNIKVLVDSFEHDIAPKLKEYANIIIDEINKIFTQFSDIVFAILGKISEFLDAHQAELKQIATSLSSISQEAGRFIVINYERAVAVVAENVKRIVEEIKALPMYEEYKERIQAILTDAKQFTVAIGNLAKDAIMSIKDFSPNNEVTNMLNLISEYIDNKINDKKVDDVEALTEIVRAAIRSVRTLMQGVNVRDVQGFDPTAYAVNYFYAVPKLVAGKFSPFNYLTGDLPLDVLKDALYSVSFNPKSWIPPFRLYAFVVQGQHIFTFDGKHITFPGKCNYLLARDAVNGNFSIAATYKDGIMTTLTLADKTDSITIKKGGQCALNKNAADFPIHKTNLEAHRHYNHITITSKAGVKIYCDPQLTTCTFSVSGFYHGQIRGLLGNGNNEPYDDFTTANGKISTSESDFGNSYKMQDKCPDVKTVDHTGHQHAPSCTALFGSASSLRICFPFVNPENFRTACDHGVAAGVKDTEQAVAAGYVSACLSKNILVFLPKEFVQCTNSDTPRALMEKFSVKVPGKSADILVVIDQVKDNEIIYKELITPMLTDLTKELGTKGITDVEIDVMGYGGEKREYASHATNGGKLGWKGKMPTLKFADPEPRPELNTGINCVDKAIEIASNVTHELVHLLGLDSQSIAYVQAIVHPFRSHASKTIIAVTGNPCHQGALLGLQKLKSMLLTQKLIHVNLITPFRDFNVKDAKTTKNIIGFNSENVFTLTDGKKKPAGGAELHKDLEYNDYCIDYVTKNDGNVFVTDNFLAAKAPQRKIYANTVAHTLADQIVSTEQGLDCQCLYRTAFDASNRCHVVHEKSKGH